MYRILRDVGLLFIVAVVLICCGLGVTKVVVPVYHKMTESSVPSAVRVVCGSIDEPCPDPLVAGSTVTLSVMPPHWVDRLQDTPYTYYWTDDKGNLLTQEKRVPHWVYYVTDTFNPWTTDQLRVGTSAKWDLAWVLRDPSGKVVLRQPVTYKVQS
jgi:hypothetical protein